MTLLSILQSVLPEKKETRIGPQYYINKARNEGFNQAISDLTDRLSKAEFLIDEEKLAIVLYETEYEAGGWVKEDREFRLSWLKISRVITSQLPSLLSVVEKKEKV